MRIVISAGGTGGHIYPALGILDKFIEKESNVDVIYIGTHNRMEKDIVTKRGIKFVELEIYGLSKSNMVRNIKNVNLINKAYNKCLNIMDTFKPDVVIGTGGYVVYPVIKAAKKRGITTFVHEQNSIPGKSNKMISKGVDLVGVSFEGTEHYFSKSKKVFYSGNPCASSATLAKKINKKDIGLDPKKKFILVVCGSLGSSSVNDVFSEYLTNIDKGTEVMYITGKAYYDEFCNNNEFSSNVFIKPYIENMASVMKCCDLIISRAGASTISEVLALCVPSIIIPSPYVANNHQYYNAVKLRECGLSYMLEEKDLGVNSLNSSINYVLDGENYKKYKEALLLCDKIDSAGVIYEKIKECLNVK